MNCAYIQMISPKCSNSAMILTSQGSSSLLTRPIPWTNQQNTFSLHIFCAEQLVSTPFSDLDCLYLGCLHINHVEDYWFCFISIYACVFLWWFAALCIFTRLTRPIHACFKRQRTTLSTSHVAWVRSECFIQCPVILCRWHSKT